MKLPQLNRVPNRVPTMSFKRSLTEPLIIVYDLETTGLSADTDRIIQISARKCERQEDGQYKETDSRMWYIKPSIPLPERITDLTGITEEMLSDKQTEEEIINEVAEYFESYAVAGYNNDSFDNMFMRNLYGRNGKEFRPKQSYDVLTYAKIRIPRSCIGRYKLSTVATYLGVCEDATFHNAEGDTQVTLGVLNRLIREDN